MERVIFIVLLSLIIIGIFLNIFTIIPTKPSITGYFITNVSQNTAVNATAFSAQRKIVRNTTGAIFAIYQSDSTHSSSKYSTDDGYSWSSPVLIQALPSDICTSPT